VYFGNDSVDFCSSICSPIIYNGLRASILVLSYRWSHVVPLETICTITCLLSCHVVTHIYVFCVEQKECFELHGNKSYNGAEAVT
jgi:hypothetical protein